MKIANIRSMGLLLLVLSHLISTASIQGSSSSHFRWLVLFLLLWCYTVSLHVWFRRWRDFSARIQCILKCVYNCEDTSVFRFISLVSRGVDVWTQGDEELVHTLMVGQLFPLWLKGTFCKVIAKERLIKMTVLSTKKGKCQKRIIFSFSHATSEQQCFLTRIQNRGPKDCSTLF